MDPENHIVVRLLRFINDMETANRYVKYLLGGEPVIVSPDVIAATQAIQNRIEMNLESNRFFFASYKIDTVLQRVAEQFNLFSLTNSIETLAV